MAIANIFESDSELEELDIPNVMLPYQQWRTYAQATAEGPRFWCPTQLLPVRLFTNLKFLKQLLQLTAEASTRERWQFGALTNRKATSSHRDPSLTSLYYY